MAINRALKNMNDLTILKKRQPRKTHAERMFDSMHEVPQMNAGRKARKENSK